MRNLLFVLLCLPALSFAQVNAYFTVSTSSGCLPVMVSITNQSTGTGTLTYSWDFGNSQNSTLQNPWPVNYISAGNYTITLMVTNGTDTSYYSQTIQVFAKPVANFSFTGNTQGCFPITVDFFDQSTPGSAPISSWLWEFGTGATSTQQSPQYTYNQAGVFAVILQISDTNGCSSSVLINSVVSSSAPPAIDFSASITNHCDVPLNVTFTNHTTGTPPLQYQWDFGDGSTSTQTNPAHTYTSQGVFDVSLTVTDAFGCTSDTTITGMINITDIFASFTTSTGYNTVCPGVPFQFINTSGNPNVYWDFGTGANSTQQEPWMQYDNTGPFDVTMIAGYGLSCADTIVVPITVQNVNASVSPSAPYSCQLPASFNLAYDGATAISDYNWTAQTDQSSVSSSSSSITVPIGASGSYDYTLIVTSQFGCLDTVTGVMVVDAITTNINASVLEGCIPLDVNFTANTYSNEPVVSWDWSFGSNQQNPTYTFVNSGTFNVDVIVTNDAGCTASGTIEIKTGPHHYPNFEICYLTNPLIVDTCKHCPRDTILFHNLTTDTLWNPIDDTDPLFEWTWFFGSSDFEPEECLDSYFAPLDTGWQYDLWMIVNYNGCRDTVHLDETDIDSIGLYISAPLIRSLTDSMSCDSTYQRYFFADFNAADYWDWDFGDGNTILASAEDTVMHNYSAIGTYWVKLTAYSDSTSCFFRDSVQIRITDIMAVYTQHADTICYGTLLTVDAQMSQDASFWHWFIDSIPAGSLDSLGIGPFNTEGIIPVHLIVEDIYHCSDTAHSEVTVTRPFVDFVGDTLIGCKPFEVEFISYSTSEMGIQTLSWNFGDYTPVVIGGDTISHTYNGAGVFSVILTVTDSVGCSRTLSKGGYIRVQNVNASFSSPDPVVCLGEIVDFASTSSGTHPMTVYWDFGNGHLDTALNTVQQHVLYADSGVYTVTIIVVDTVGCADTVVAVNYVTIQQAIADFTVVSDSSSCYPFAPDIINNSPASYQPTHFWTFGDGFIASDIEPYHEYSFPGDYWMVYTITTSDGCQAKDSVLIYVGGPFGTINVFPDSICKGDEVQFFMTDTINVSYVNWNFGDGYGSNDLTTTHTYSYVPVNGEFYVSLILFSDSTCYKPAETDTIHVQEVIAGFDIINTETSQPDFENCSPFTVNLPNTSYGATSWSWDYGNGQNFSGNLPPDMTYLNPTPSDTVFTITQIIANDLGCTDTLIQDITVWGTPPVTVSNDTLICLGDEANLMATGGEVVVWTPNTAINNPASYNPTVNPGIDQYYTATVYDARGCFNADSVLVVVQQVPVILHSNDTSIMIGETVTLFATADQNNVTYTWSPNYELSGTTGSYVFARPLENTTYTIVMIDSMGCFELTETVFIEVIENYSLDVPNAFTPNGDAANDKIFVRGWGIKELLEFSIYNRWGERIYFSDDLYEGWDGTFNGKKQNLDTYTYYVKVLTWGNSILEKKGNITLLR
jgi:gliding motility-associated-like protein